MKRILITTFIAALALVSCDGNRQDEAVREAIVKNINDNAFKSNATADIEIIKVIRVDSTNDLFIDSARRLKIWKKLDLFENLKLNDSLVYYDRLDSVLEVKMETDRKPKPIYKAKVFVKASFVDNNSKKSSNLLDTVIYAFTKDYELLKIKL